MIAFCFNSMYVYTDGSIENTHPIRRSVWTAFPWLLIHLPMSAGLLIGGHVSAYATNHVMEQAHRWLWGGGLGIGMFGMWVLAQLFRDDDPKGKLLFSKVRVYVRCRYCVERLMLSPATPRPPTLTRCTRLHPSSLGV